MSKTEPQAVLGHAGGGDPPSSARVAELEARVAELEGKLRVEHRKVAALHELHRALASTLDLDRLLALLLDKLRELLDAERVTLYLVDDTGDHLTSRFMQGGAVTEIRLKVGEGIAGWVAKTGATVNLPDAYADPRFQRDVDQRTGFRTRSMLCMAMPGRQGRIVGAVQVLNKRTGPFDADDEALLGAVASHSAITIENSKLYLSLLGKNAALIAAQEDLRKRVEDLHLLVEIEREVSAATHLDDLLDRLLRRALQLIDAEAGAVLLRDRVSGELYFRTAVGGPIDVLRRLRIPEGRGIVGWVAQKLQPLIVNDPASDPRHDRPTAIKLEFLPHSIVAAPLVYTDEQGAPEALGAIELLNRRNQPGFDEGDVKLLSLIAGHVSRAVQQARAKEERSKQDRLAAIGQLLSGVLHDLRTPMTIISGYAQMMVSTDEPEVREQYSDAIQKQFELMAAMTREVLQFARGETQLLIRRVYLQKFFAEVREQLEPSLAAKHVQLEIDARYTGVAYFDELKLYRVIHNIARNAVQAMPDGGRFTIVADVDDAETLRLEFTDTGSGIPAELEGRLFQLFTTAGKRDGTGLGLAIVKKIVDEHNGQVSYRSHPGGTTFVVTLPLVRELSRDGTEPSPDESESESEDQPVEPPPSAPA